MANLCGGRQGLLMVFGRLQMLDWCGASLLQNSHRGPQSIQQWASLVCRRVALGLSLLSTSVAHRPQQAWKTAMSRGGLIMRHIC